MRQLAVLLLALLTSMAQARDRTACEPEIEDALRKINARVDIRGDVVSPQCKRWPPSAGKTVAALMAADASHYDELTLFVPEGSRLRPVFGMSMERQRAVEGCLGKCPNAVWDSASFTISIGTRLLLHHRVARTLTSSGQSGRRSAGTGGTWSRAPT